MARITDLPELADAEIDATVRVAVVKGGASYQAALGDLGAAAADRAQAIADGLALGSGVFRRAIASLLTTTNIPGFTQITYGALSRNQPGAGIDTTATAILAGNEAGHWTLASGRLYPSATGDTANLSEGYYLLTMDDGVVLGISIEANTWDVNDQSEWNVIAYQGNAALAGKTIALRNTSPITLGITGVSGTPFRRGDLRVGGVPCTIKGRLGAVGDWASYCPIDKVEALRGARGVTFRHLRTTPVAESKFGMLGEAANIIDDITIDDCWITGQVADPNGDYSTSSNYPNNGKDLVKTTGSVAASVGNITITNCLVEWGATCINIGVNITGKQSVITGNEVRYFYDDGIAVSGSTNPRPVTISNNYVHDSIGKASDSANPHPDAIRIASSASATADWLGITIEGNVVANGTSRGDMQCIFLDDMKTTSADSGFFFVATIRDNYVLSRASQGIWIVQAKNCLVERNTVVAWDRAAPTTPTIIVGATAGVTTSTTGGGNVAQNNIADNVAPATSGLTLADNVVTGANGTTIDYLTVLTGPTFAPASKAAAIAALTSLVDAGAGT